MTVKFLRLCGVLGLLLPTIINAQVPAVTELPAQLKVVLDGHSLPAGSYSLMVQDVTADTPLLAVNSDAGLNPASSIKTLTTYTALETLGPGYTWQTELYALGPVSDGVLQGDLLLKGSGDPFLVEEQLRSMLKGLQRAGVRHITGQLLLDGSYFDPSVEQGEAIDNQGGRSYNTDPNAVLANFQSVTFYFYPHGNGRDVLILADPQLPNLKINNRLSQHNAACSGYQRGISFSVNPDDASEVVFSGRFPSRCSRYQMSREVLDTHAYTYGLFVSLWQELGGSIDGPVGSGRAPEGAEPILVWNSSSLSEVIRSINKFSNNLMSRHMLLTLGAEKFQAPAVEELGIQAVMEFLDDKGLNLDSLNLVNGAGLSRDTRISAALMTQILQTAWRSPYMPEFVASLPINGVDGTMRNRLRGRMSGHMHVKTGTLDEVSAIAGYVHASSGRVYSVVGMLNHELADRGPGVELNDALLSWVYSQ